jgi:hypothetical protein
MLNLNCRPRKYLFLGFPIEALYGQEGMKTAILVELELLWFFPLLGILVATMYSKGSQMAFRF